MAYSGSSAQLQHSILDLVTLAVAEVLHIEADRAAPSPAHLYTELRSSSPTHKTKTKLAGLSQAETCRSYPGHEENVSSRRLANTRKALGETVATEFNSRWKLREAPAHAVLDLH